jgi:hypothetical protein
MFEHIKKSGWRGPIAIGRQPLTKYIVQTFNFSTSKFKFIIPCFSRSFGIHYSIGQRLASSPTYFAAAFSMFERIKKVLGEDANHLQILFITSFLIYNSLFFISCSLFN